MANEKMQEQKEKREKERNESKIRRKKEREERENGFSISDIWNIPFSVIKFSRR